MDVWLLNPTWAPGRIYSSIHLQPIIMIVVLDGKSNVCFLNEGEDFDCSGLGVMLR